MAVLDYHQRRQVAKNRPKSRGGGVLVLGLVAGVFIVFGIGFGAGWLTGSRHAQKKAAALRSVAEPAKNPDSGAGTPPSAGLGKSDNTPPLTFYNTLKGGKGVLGTGINSPKPVEKGSEGSPAGQGGATPPVQKVLDSKAPDGAKSQPGRPEEQLKNQGNAKGKFSVQVASYREKKEAEASRDKLAATGLPAFIIESHLKDHGVWYRLRVGKGLEQKEASDLLTKVGKGAMLVPE